RRFGSQESRVYGLNIARTHGKVPSPAQGDHVLTSTSSVELLDGSDIHYVGAMDAQEPLRRQTLFHHRNPFTHLVGCIAEMQVHIVGRCSNELQQVEVHEREPVSALDDHGPGGRGWLSRAGIACGHGSAYPVQGCMEALPTERLQEIVQRLRLERLDG